MTSGMTVTPSAPRITVVSRTEVSGSCSIAAHEAPIPMAMAGTSDRPGRWERAMPPTAPRKIAGKVGPPRKATREAGVGEPLAEQQEEQRPTG